MDYHSKCVERLCRICGNLLGTKSFEVSKYLTLLEEAFYIDHKKDNPEVHPKRFCIKCYKQSKNITGRGSTPTGKCFQFDKHSAACATCENFSTLLKGGKRKKIKKAGRPSEKNAVWSRDFSEHLSNELPVDNFPVDVKLNPALNPQLEICLCTTCEQIMRQPIKIETCEHGFCLKCFIRLVEGQGIHHLNCPVCDQPFKQEQVSSYRTVVSLREKLVVACTRCDKKYSARQKAEYVEHASKCKIEPFKLMDILSIPSAKRMPYGAEQIASHVVKLKMAESKTPNNIIQLPSGSSRVRIFSFILLIIMTCYIYISCEARIFVQGLPMLNLFSVCL